MVIAGNPVKRLVGDRRSFDQTNRVTEPPEALAFDFHALRIVIRLPKVFTQCVTENLALLNGQHAPPPLHPNDRDEPAIEQPKLRLTTLTLSTQ
jgi:hypothetical protein